MVGDAVGHTSGPRVTAKNRIVIEGKEVPVLLAADIAVTGLEPQ